MNNRISFNLIIPVLCAMGLLVALGNSGVAQPSDATYQTYRYHGDRFRDPFVPLLGQGRGSSKSIVDSGPQIGSLGLKGIIQDAQGRMALLTSGVNSYILRGGRLYDSRNRKMKGISGVIKPSSVILIGSDKTVRELRIKVPI